MPDDDRYSLTELADLAGVTPRTVRYYLGQGLLPAVGQSGPGSKYDAGHLMRLRLIRRLQAEHLPLAEIRRRLDGMADDDIRTLAGTDEPEPPSDSALDYLRGVLAGGSAAPRAPTPDRQPMAGPAPPSVREAAPLYSRALMSVSPLEVAQAPALAPLAEPAAPAGPAPIERSQWERVALAPDVELHIRRPLTRAQQKGIDRLVTIARELLEEDRS